jgi:integrase
MKTSEVLAKVLKGKRIKPVTQRHYSQVLGSLARYSEEWPDSGIVINEWLGSLGSFADSTVKMWFDYVNSAGKYIERVSGRNPDSSWKIPNPCADADRPRVEKKRRRYFTAGELMRIIDACRDVPERVLILSLVDSTCRIGEIGVNREGEGGLYGRNVGESWMDVKGKTGERRYRLDAFLCEAMKAMAGGDDQPVFRDASGKTASVDALKNRVKRVIKRAGITGSKLGPHTLRHSGASLVAQETGSALAVKALLQHDNIDTSMEYIHDAEAVIQQRISPLRLVSEKLFGKGNGLIALEPKQLTMGGEVVLEAEVEVVEGECKDVEAEVDLVEGLFPEIKDGYAVRSVFSTDDLRLLRRVFVGYAKYDEHSPDVVKCRELMKRMLRKVK